MKHQTSGESSDGQPVWANIPEAFRTHSWPIEEVDRANPNRQVLEALTGHRDLHASDGDPGRGAECFWCGWKFDEFTNPADFPCASEGDEQPPVVWAMLDPYFVELRERRISRAVLDGLPDVWVPRSTPPHIPMDPGASGVTEAEAASIARHSGISADDLTPEAAAAVRERIAREIATGNVLRYLMWLIGTEVRPASAAAEQATVNLLFRIRDEFGFRNPAEAGLLLRPNATSPTAVIDEAHARGAVMRFTLGDLQLYPGFQFDGSTVYEVTARLRETATRCGVSENSLVLWMVRATTHLGGPEGGRPVDLFATQPDALAALAENSFGVQW